MSDNFRIDVSSEGEKDLLHCLEILARQHHSFECSYITKEGKVPTLVFQWCNCGDEGRPKDAIITTNIRLGAKQVLPIVIAWLDGLDYGAEPDHDGDNGKGWRIFNEEWTHVLGDRYGAFGIQPCWMLYGK